MKTSSDIEYVYEKLNRSRGMGRRIPEKLCGCFGCSALTLVVLYASYLFYTM